MIEKTLGRSGYRARKTEYNWSLRVWTSTYECVVYLDEEEARQLIEDLQKEFFGDRRHSD